MTEVFGIPVSGDPLRTRGARADQRPLSDLREVFEALIADERVIEFGWEQYTPYFNDGDVCEFGVHAPWIRTVDDAEEDDGYDLEISDTHPTLGTKGYKLVNLTEEEKAERRARYGSRYAPDDEWRSFSKRSKHPDLLELAKKLDVDDPHFEDALYDAFGDHARVTVTKTGIQIDQYDHE